MNTIVQSVSFFRFAFDIFSILLFPLDLWQLFVVSKVQYVLRCVLSAERTVEVKTFE